MAYMKVLDKTDSQLRLLREPSFLSKAIFAGFLVGILGIFLFGSECCIVKLLIGLCALFLSCFLIDNYEICEIDKDLAVLKLFRSHWCQYLFDNIGLSSSPAYITIKLEDIQDIVIQEQHATAIGKAYQVAFVLYSGIKVGATEVFTSNSYSEHSEIASIISNFLNLPVDVKNQGDPEYEGDGSSSSGDDMDVEIDGFEQISQADIKELEEELSKASQGAECIGDFIPNTDNAAAAAACAVDDHGDNPDQGLEENAASS